MKIRKTILLCLLLVLMTACTETVSQTATETEFLPSPKPSETKTTQPTSTQIPATPTSTIQPVSGLANWQINVRSGPGVYFPLLGQINQGETIQIIGMDPSSEWLAILFDNGSDGKAWVSKEYVQSTELGNLPVLGLVTLSNGTPAPQANLSQKLNIRSGPGTHYESLGLLPANSTIWLIGRNEDDSWFMIDYPSSQGGKGWVIAGYVNSQSDITLPVLDSLGNPVVEPPPTQPAQIKNTPIPIYSVAIADNDSINNPSVSVEFSPMGTRQFSFSSDLSLPEGDQIDWIEVIPYGPHTSELVSVDTSLSCFGNGSIEIKLFQDDQEITDWGNLICGDNAQDVSLVAGLNYIFQLKIVGSTESSYIEYTFTVKTIIN